MKNKKALIIALVFILIISTLGIASAADAAQLSAGAAKPTATPGRGLWTPSPTPKPTPTPGRGLWTPSPTPKPTATPEPVPSFEPGLREDHEGHDLRYDVLEVLEYTHKIRIYCKDCKKKVRTYTEYHTLDESGHCTACTYQCKHQRTYVRTEQADGSKRSWDGEYITYPGTETTICYHCGKVLKYENKIIRKFHTMHLNTTKPEWIPNGTNGHYADVTCLDCDTAFRATHYHEYNREAPFTDDGDPDTHTHMISCRDCGYSEERREPHAWVHESYKKDVSLGTDEGHIEVQRCSVCGAKREVKQPHEAGTHIAYRQEGDAKTHTEVLRCKLCGEQFELARPHSFEIDSYKNDGDTETHIEVLICTECGQKADGDRAAHKPMHITYKSISDTQDQEILRCNMCELEIRKDPVAHKFDGFSYESNGKDKHTVYRACSRCGEREKNGKTFLEGHYLGSDYCCVKCHQASTHDGEHRAKYAPIDWLPVDDLLHVPVFRCEIPKCHAIFENHGLRKVHTYDPITMKCTACGYLKEGCEHHFNRVVYYTKDGHRVGGECANCGKRISEPLFSNHSMRQKTRYFFQYNEDTHICAQVEECTVCGYERIAKTSEQGHKFEREGDNRRCKECGYLESAGCEHSFEYTPVPERQTAVTHDCKMKCTKCGIESYKQEAHDLRPVTVSAWQTTDNKTHFRTVHYQCSVCGYETTVREDGSHEMIDLPDIYRPIDLEYHERVIARKECKICGYSVETVKKQRHNWVQKEDHKICDLCGRRKDLVS